MTENPVNGPDSSTRSVVENRRRAHKLFSFGSTGLIALLVYYGFTANVAAPFHLYMGLAMIAFAALPSLLWARRGGDQLPVFEVLMLTTANTYALPLLSGNANLAGYTSETVTVAALAVLLFQSVAIVTHLTIRGRPGIGSAFTEEILTRDMQKYIVCGLVLSTIYTFIYVFFEEIIPNEINSILRAVFYGIGLVCTFVQARRWGQGLLATNQRSILLTLLIAQVVIQFSTLFLVGGISIIVLGLVGYVAGSHRLPLVPTILLLAIIAVLHNGKSTMRDRYWLDDQRREQVGFSELLPFYVEWIKNGFSVRQSSGEQELAKKLFERTSLFHILCLVIASTPERQPYLDGATYAQIPAQFIPRFFWPDKPPGHISTYTLAIYYGLQRAEDTAKTTIGFGVVSEAYANFGFFGIGVLAFIVGVFYKKVQVATAQSPLLSYAGLFLVVLMAWSFQTEFTLSIWLSSMFQACVAVLGVPFVLRNFFG